MKPCICVISIQQIICIIDLMTTLYQNCTSKFLRNFFSSDNHFFFICNLHIR